MVNPVLGYKLDPGEPGVPFGAPASQSFLRVMSQEFANYIDFKKQAAEQGGFIIYGGIYLDVQKRGSFLAAVAGKTKVLIYVPGQQNGNTSQENQQNKIGEDSNLKRNEIERKIDELYRKLQQTVDPTEREKLLQQILLLTMAINALMAGMKIPELLVGIILNATV
ncbi:hypothetical protein IM42_04075 [Fervidobacterium sp. SC_NGM5_O18]|uniref:Uncharacterized protein n=1 Tax=Fervidobacterium pennivorans TaxID=93466 RepID=A0A172T5D9_FERPE|nr:hypothetical protein JM64_01920 [Fervidobacterium pennivorans]PHJ12480.1 hypothetical protein IM42_04075 [Fervidobacterium sp. SC_NGM5_O18]